MGLRTTKRGLLYRECRLDNSWRPLLRHSTRLAGRDSNIHRPIGLFVSAITHVGHISQSDRPDVILIVHGRHDTVSLADVSDLPRGWIAMQTDFLPVLPHHEIILAINAQQLALNSVNDLQLLSPAYIPT